MTPDAINGVFELGGGLLMVMNCRRLYLDKQVKGVSIWPVIFFTAWGIWNLYFYPSMGAWLSFCGGTVIAIANSVWFCQSVYYLYIYQTPPVLEEPEIIPFQTLAASCEDYRS